MSVKIIKCEVCGEDIASSAKRCPKCGAKVKKPLFKQTGFYVLCAVICVICSLVIPNLLRNNSSTIELVNNSSAEKEKISDIVKLLDENELKFNQIYRGEDAIVTGPITSIQGRYTSNNLSHTFESDIVINGTVHVDVSPSVAAQFNVGDKVTVRGKITTSLYDDIYMYGPNDVTAN